MFVSHFHLFILKELRNFITGKIIHLHPWVCHNLLDSWSLHWVPLEHGSDQTLELNWNIWHLLVVFMALPNGIRSVFCKASVLQVVQFSCFERLSPSSHGVEAQSYSENVYRSTLIRIKIFRHFWSFVAKCSTICPLVWSISFFIMRMSCCRETKIG